MNSLLNYLTAFDKGKKFLINAAIDGSGSMESRYQNKFLTDLYGIVSQYPQVTMNVLSFDTNIHNPKSFNYKNKDAILKYKVVGGGGTYYDAIWDFWMANDRPTDIAFILSDGQTAGGWGPSSYCKTVWAMVEKRYPTPAFGNHFVYQ